MEKIIFVMVVGLLQSVSGDELQLTNARSIHHVSGEITYKVELPNEDIPEQLHSFDLEINLAGEWRVRVTPQGVSKQTASPEVMNVVHTFKDGRHVQVVRYNPKSLSLSLPEVTNQKLPMIIPNTAEIYENIFPYWDEWGITALWLTFCSDRLSEMTGIPGTLYTMDRESTLSAATNFVRTPTSPGARFSSTAVLVVPFSAAFPTLKSPPAPPLFEFKVTSQEVTSLGSVPTLIQARFSVAKPDANRNIQFFRALLIEVKATNFSLVDSFSFGDEMVSPLAVKDYRLRTKIGHPIAYTTTNGIPNTDDPRLQNYAERYRKKEEVLNPPLTEKRLNRKRIIVLMTILLSSIPVTVFFLFRKRPST